MPPIKSKLPIEILIRNTLIRTKSLTRKYPKVSSVVSSGGCTIKSYDIIKTVSSCMSYYKKGESVNLTPLLAELLLPLAFRTVNAPHLR